MENVFAAIDIGSNAARLLIKEADSKSRRDKPVLKKLLLVRVPLRLGFDVFSKGRVSDKKAENLLRLMKAYRQLMRIYGVDRMRACATSAMRDAENGPALQKLIEKETGIKIEIITGEEEARIVVANHLERAGESTGNYLYVDVGGGSTEVNLLSEGKLLRTFSFNIGTVRILSDKVKPSEWERLNREIGELAGKYGPMTIIGSGGNINRIYRMTADKDPATQSIPVSALSRLYHLLAPLSVEQREEIYGLKPDRADVIVPAASIFLAVASLCGAERIIVPVIGVADGIIDCLYRDSLPR